MAMAAINALNGIYTMRVSVLFCTSNILFSDYLIRAYGFFFSASS